MAAPIPHSPKKTGSAGSESSPTARNKGRPKGTGAQRVYDGLRDDILHLRLRPGATLDEASLLERYGVSRTPVREALIRLSADRLITLLPNRGAQVSQIDFSAVPQFFEAMAVCQRMILRLAAARRSAADIDTMRTLNAAFAEAAAAHDAVGMSETNKAFHAVMADACGNRHFQDMYDDLLATGLRLALSAFGTAFEAEEVDEAYFREVVHQHEAMIDALVSQDADAADELARRHTDLFRQRMLKAIECVHAEEIVLG